MTASSRGIKIFVHDAKSYVLGYDRADDIHDRFRSLQDLQQPRSKVLERSLRNTTVADPSNSRCIAGLLNGNMGVAKSMMGELTDSTNRAQASGFFSLVWAVGVTIGWVTLHRKCA